MNNPPRLLVKLILVISMFSCVSIRSNYLGRNQIAVGDTTLLQEPSPMQKKMLQVRADSLLNIVSELKKKNRHLHGREINRLYSNFAEQLNNDRYYQYLLQKQSVDKDSLSYQQYLAALELMSSAAVYDKSYQTNRLIRRTINRGDRGNNIPKNILQKSRNYLYSHSIRKTLENNYAKYYNTKTDSLFGFLPTTSNCEALRKRVFRDNDRFHSFIYGFVYGSSYLIGNTIGIFHGETDREKYASLLAPQLQPFDIVVMKSRHHLTDQFIPGYFGHGGIWLGNELATKMTHRPAKSDDTKGRAMVEVLRNGVKISTLREFCDGDVFLIIRLSNLTESQRKALLTNINKQLKKDYDFNFDIESPEAITCTELVYLTFDFVDWQIRYTWSRFTLSPDDLVQTAMKSNQFELPAFINEGSLITQPDTSFVRTLVGQESP
jgi:hypothetical protein